MEIMLIKKNQCFIRKIYESYQLILTKDLNRNVSQLARQKHHETAKNIKGDRTYYTIEGKLVIKM